MKSSNETCTQEKAPVLKSPIWSHYIIDEVTKKATCKYCGMTYAADTSKNGISNLMKHISKCKKFSTNVDKKQRTLVLQPLESKIGSTFNMLDCRDLIAKMLILEELPIKLVEADSFKTLLTYMNNKFIMPSRKTIARDIRKIYEAEASKLKEYFFSTSQRVCLTTDTWTSIQNLNYMVLTCHYIDEDWKVQKKILNFCLIEDHKGETIAKEVEKCLLKWEIENVTTVTVDNASSNDVAVSNLVKTVRNWKGLVLNGEHMHMRCFTHILNLIVADGLKEHDESITRVRKAVKYVRSSPARLQRFKACVEAVKITCKSNLSLDVPTRWNSTYLMLSNAEKYEAAFDKLAENESSFILDMGVEGPPTTADWSSIRQYTKFLKTFHTMTANVSASSHIAANMYVGEVCNLKIAIEEFAEGDNMTLRKMVMGIQNKFDKYWGSFEKFNMFVYVAVVLDPSCKTRFLRHCLSILFGNNVALVYSKEVEIVLHKLYADYKGNSGSNDQDSRGVDIMLPPKPTTKGPLRQARSTAVYARFYDPSNISELHEERKLSEIDIYLSEKLETFSDSNDILRWWKNNSDRYPVLSVIAKDILIIPISTVASESAFSCGSRVLDTFCSSLTPTNVEALICTQSWLNSFNHLKITEEVNDATECSTTADEVCASTSREWLEEEDSMT